MIRKMTPVLIVDRIEPILPLWEALGFARTTAVPHGDALGFVILARDGAEVMYQTRDSVRADEPHVLDGTPAPGAAALFIEVEDVAALAAALPPGTDIVTPRRQTFYGSTETIFRDAAGNIVTLAQMS